MILLDGQILSQKVLSGLHFLPSTKLGIILVGDDPHSLKYVDLKLRAAATVGVEVIFHHLPLTTSESELIKLIDQLNTDPNITGFFIQLPLPPAFDRRRLLDLISPQKDVDGLTTNSPFVPAVVGGIVRLLCEYKIDLNNKNIVIINDSDLIGRPLFKQLSTSTAKVTICNINTQDTAKIASSADILITATGVRGLVTSSFIKPGAVVIDAATGDVDFKAVAPLCSYITPTYGGVGPMTIASLLYNLSTIKQ